MTKQEEIALASILATKLTETSKVHEWRGRELVRMGFSVPEAATLAANPEADIHEIERWLRSGCSHAQVMQIVEPL